MDEIREQIGLNDSYQDVVIKMSEGNPGAISVLMGMVRERGAIEALGLALILDDMNIRGTQIWIGYKNFCDCDLNKFMESVVSRNPEMIKVINEFGREGNHKWKAVESGASVPNQRQCLWS